MAYVDSKNVVHVQYEPMFRLILQNPQVNKSTSPNATRLQHRGLHQFSTEILQLAQHLSNCIAMSSGNVTHLAGSSTHRAGRLLKTVIYSTKMIKT